MGSRRGLRAMHVVVSDVYQYTIKDKRLLGGESVEWWVLHTVEEGSDSNVAVGGHLDQFLRWVYVR